MKDSLSAKESVQRAAARCSGSVVRTAFLYLKNMPDAEDIAQEVFLTYLEKEPEFENEKHERAWLVRVAANKSINLLRSRSRRGELPLLEDLSYLPKEESGLLEAVLSLEEKYRLPLHLYYYEDYSILEIAALLQTKPATIGTRLARARKQLKEKLGEWDE